jgi:hypothetical protein
MNVIKGQHACVKFCFKLGKNVNETLELLQQAFGYNTEPRKLILVISTF